MRFKSSSVVLWAGLMLIILSVVGSGTHFLLRSGYSSEINTILYVGDSILAAIGVATISIAYAIKKIEERVARIEARLNKE